LSELALHSVVAPNEEVANKNRTAFTKENLPSNHVEFNTIPSVFFVNSHNAFGVHFGVRFGGQFTFLSVDQKGRAA
jgi:hypothetical protein